MKNQNEYEHNEHNNEQIVQVYSIKGKLTSDFTPV